MHARVLALHAVHGRRVLEFGRLQKIEGNCCKRKASFNPLHNNGGCNTDKGFHNGDENDNDSDDGNIDKGM